jgi:hypothetical protein
MSFPTAELVAKYPPRLDHPNKKAVYRVACPEESAFGGTLTFSRWAEMRLPAEFPRDARTDVEARPDPFGYEPVPEGSNRVEWYVNFADRNLFFGYGGPLFAQDEMQVAEHPVLGSLREALLQQRVALWTSEKERPTPVLVMGVERRCAISTDPNPAEGRPRGLYGQSFAVAGEDAVRKATRPLDPPTITHLIAISALTPGTGEYQKQEIEYLLATAYTGFRAARLETERAAGKDHAVVIHTGFWGCGAFGGNRELMAIVQVLAAHFAGIDRLVFHTYDAAGMAPLEKALSFVEQELAKGGPLPGVDAVIRKIEARRFRWGIGDGS